MLTAIEAHTCAKALSYLVIWTIYDKPSDYPEGFIARMHVASRKEANSGPTTATISAPTLNEVRAQLPPGLVCLGRNSCDEPQIVESWI